MPTVAAGTLISYCTQVLEAAKVPSEDAALVARSLVDANLRGHDSHGVMRLPQYLGFLREGHYKVGVELKIERESAAIVVADGQWGLGQVQSHRLLAKVLEKCATLGLAAGVARDCGHIGRLGEYAEAAAQRGVILIATVNNCGAGQRVAPPGGREPRLGTNPLCIAVPTHDDVVLLDFGTSVVAEGKVRVYYIDNKKPVPAGWLLDADGQPTVNPAVLYEPPLGSILPMGGTQAYKGFGLSLVLDLLAGGLSGGRSPFPGAPPAKGNNVVFLALNPEFFAGAEHLLGEATQLIRFVRETPTIEGVDKILIPGDPERMALDNRATLGIPLQPEHWRRLVEAGEQLGVVAPVLTD